MTYELPASFLPQSNDAEAAPTSNDIAQGSMPELEISMSDATSEAPNGLDPDLIYVYANSITQSSSVEGANTIAFDIIFNVTCTCPESGVLSTYTVVKRIAVDKLKMAQEAKQSTPVTVVESKKPEPEKYMMQVSAERMKTIAGLK